MKARRDEVGKKKKCFSSRGRIEAVRLRRPVDYIFFLGDHASIETRVFPSFRTHGKGKLEVPLLIDKTRPGGEMQRSWPVNGACKKGRVENGSRYRREGLRPRSACDT